MNAHKHPAAAELYVASLDGDPLAYEKIHHMMMNAEHFSFSQTNNGFHSSARFASKAAVVLFYALEKAVV